MMKLFFNKNKKIVGEIPNESRLTNTKSRSWSKEDSAFRSTAFEGYHFL